MTDAKNQTKNYAYYVDGSVKGVTYVNALVSTPNVSLTYDPKYRRLATLTDGTGLTTFGYHSITVGATLGAGQLATVDGPLANDTISYKYDELGRSTNRAINNVGEGFVFDGLGRMTSHTNVLGAFIYAYAGSSHRLSSVTAPAPNSQVTTFDYFDALGDFRLKQIWNKKSGGATLSKFDYQYDVMGRIREWTQQKDAATPEVCALGDPTVA